MVLVSALHRSVPGPPITTTDLDRRSEQLSRQRIAGAAQPGAEDDSHWHEPIEDLDRNELSPMGRAIGRATIKATHNLERVGKITMVDRN